jgi:hypothetical protein
MLSLICHTGLQPDRSWASIFSLLNGTFSKDKKSLNSGNRRAGSASVRMPVRIAVNVGRSIGQSVEADF